MIAASVKETAAGFCTKQNLITCFAVSLSITSTRLLNITLYPQIGDIFPIAREIATYTGILVFLILIPVATHKPAIFKGRLITPILLVIFLVSTLISIWGIALKSPVIITVSAAIRAVTSMWFVIVAYIALMQLSPKNCILAIMVAYALKYLWIAITESLPVTTNTVIYIVFVIGAMLLLRPYVEQTFTRIASSGSQAELETANPYSFLPPTHTVFTMVLLYQLVFGFVLTFNSVANMPQSISASGLAILVLCIVVFADLPLTMDMLFNAATFFIIAGFLFVLVFTNPALATGMPLVQICLTAGSDIFSILFTIMMVGIARRNITGALPLFFLYGAASSIGLSIGVVVGRQATSSIVSDQPFAMLVIVLIVLLFVLYNMVIQHRFNFEKTVSDIHPAAVVPVSDISGDLFTSSCDTISERYRLTPREKDILTLLARGHGGQAIQDKLVISRNTVKSYVRGIYQKLDIHSQQELIDLVENTEDEIAAK